MPDQRTAEEKVAVALGCPNYYVRAAISRGKTPKDRTLALAVRLRSRIDEAVEVLKEQTHGMGDQAARREALRILQEK